MAQLDLKERIRGRTRQAVASAGSDLESILVGNAPTGETQQLSRNTRVTPAGPNRLRIEVLVDYASYVREGTAPHPIDPVNRQYLAFEWAAAPANMGRLPDGRVLARHVDHPGTPPNTWYDDGINRLPDLIQSRLFTSTL